MMNMSMRGTEMNGAGLVSVIVPAYRHEQYVTEAIESVINQTYRNIELLVLDDGSPDRTWEIVRGLEERCRQRFARVKFWRQENQGICGALNTLLSEVRGDYVSRLDSDDLYKPRAIERLESFLAANPDYGFVVGNNDLIDENGDQVFWTKKRCNTKREDQAVYRTFGDYLKRLRPEIDFESEAFGQYFSFLRGNYVGNGYLIRRAIIDRFRFTNEAPQEDHYMLMQIAKQTRLKYLDEIFHSYRWHSCNNIKKSDKMWNFARRTMRHELKLLKAAGDKGVYEKAEAILAEVSRKTKLNLGFLEIYKTHTFFAKDRYVLRLGSHDFHLKTKK